MEEVELALPAKELAPREDSRALLLLLFRELPRARVPGNQLPVPAILGNQFPAVRLLGNSEAMRA